jgi:hypothetical protein
MQPRKVGIFGNYVKREKFAKLRIQTMDMNAAWAISVEIWFKSGYSRMGHEAMRE